VEIGLQRVETRGERDRFERERVSFFENVRNTYLQRAKQYPQQYRVIDAAQTLEQVQQQLREVLSHYIELNR
jgi:dTMP kinase